MAEATVERTKGGRTGSKSLSTDTVGSCYVGLAYIVISGPSGVPVRTASAALCAVALAALGLRWKSSRDTYLPGLAIIFVAWCTTSILWSDHPDQTLVEATTLSLVTLTAIFTANAFSASSIVRGIIYGATTIAVLSVSTAIIDPSQGIANDASGALQGIYVQRNILASVLVPGFVAAACGSWAFDRRRPLAVVALALAASIVAARSTTGLASALAAIVVAASVSVVMQFPPGKRLLPAIGAGAAVALIVELITQNFDALVAEVGRDPTFTGRTDIWAAVWTRINDNSWLGHGWGAVWADGDRAGDYVRSYIGYFIDHSHSGALDIMVQVGWVGVGLVVALMLQLAVLASRVYFRGSTRLGIWPLTTFVMFVIYNLSESQLTTPLGWFMLVILVMMVLRDAAESRPSPSEA